MNDLKEEITAFRLTRAMKKQIDKAADKLGIKRGDFIRMCIQKGLKDARDVTRL